MARGSLLDFRLNGIGRRWVCKVKRTLGGAVDKCEDQLVARGFSQLPGVYHGEIFTSADCLPQYGPQS